jgi:hypothetical protein
MASADLKVKKNNLWRLINHLLFSLKIVIGDFYNKHFRSVFLLGEHSIMAYTSLYEVDKVT